MRTFKKFYYIIKILNLSMLKNIKLTNKILLNIYKLLNKNKDTIKCLYFISSNLS